MFILYYQPITKHHKMLTINAMKANFLFILLITTGFFCQKQGTLSKINKPTPPSILAANKLGIDDKFIQEAFLFYDGGFSGVLLEIPNGAIPTNEKDSTYVSSFYIDATEVCNLHYRAFLEWNYRIYVTMPQVSASLLPDTTIWLKQFPNEAIGGLLKDHYFRNSAFNYYPVVGISWEQAQAYALWRSDRINEAILINNGHIAIDAEGQQGENNFGTLNYLNRLYQASPGDKPMIDGITGNERPVKWSDNILLPNYRLPIASELAYAVTQTKEYSKNKALKTFQKKVQNHNKKYPLPTYYDHQQFNLPHCILEESTIEAPYHLDNNVAEWTQQYYNTSERYTMYYHGYDEDNRPFYYIPIWAKKVIDIWQTGVDTVFTNKFAPKHAISNHSPYKGFRCVMPNLW